MALLRALLYLRLTSLANLVRGRLRRLRQPKYLAGTVAGAAYIWFFFIRGFGRHSNSESLAMAFGEGRAEIFAAIILSIFVLLIWVLPSDQPGLAFTEPEVAFLFPAPLSRGQLIHYKLLDGLVTSLLGAVFFAIMSTGLRHGWLGALRHFGAWWALNANLSMHQSVAAFAISRLAGFGLSRTWRRAILLVWAFVLVGTVLLFLFNHHGDSIAWMLWPARLVVRPFLVDSLGGYALALLSPLGLLALQYLLVHRLESPFEEASIVRAQKTAELVARARSGRSVRVGGAPATARREPFRLGDRLPPEFALLWKNLMVMPPYFNRKVFLGAAAVIVFAVNWLQRHPDFDGPKMAGIGGFISLVILAYIFVFGPQLARHDLRSDLLHADMLKAWPLPGWRIVLGSLLAPTVLLTSLSWLLLLFAGLSIVPPANQPAWAWLTPELRGVVALALALVMPALCAVQLLVPNAATLIFPAWTQTGRPSANGMDVMGQRMIFFVGQLLCLVFALLPAVLAAGSTIFLTQWAIGPSAAVLLAAVPVLLIFLVELWLGVHWVGLKFEALDISAELRP